MSAPRFGQKVVKAPAVEETAKLDDIRNLILHIYLMRRDNIVEDPDPDTTAKVIKNSPDCFSCYSHLYGHYDSPALDVGDGTLRDFSIISNKAGKLVLSAYLEGCICGHRDGSPCCCRMFENDSRDCKIHITAQAGGLFKVMLDSLGNHPKSDSFEHTVSFLELVRAFGQYVLIEAIYSILSPEDQIKILNGLKKLGKSKSK